MTSRVDNVDEPLLAIRASGFAALGLVDDLQTDADRLVHVAGGPNRLLYKLSVGRDGPEAKIRHSAPPILAASRAG
jgi:hypothetical protein